MSEERLTPQPFQITVRNPTRIYDLLTGYSPQLGTSPLNTEVSWENPDDFIYFDGDLSHTIFNHKVIAFEATSVQLFPPFETDRPTYSMHSLLRLAEGQRQQPHRGYYSDTRLALVLNSLVNKGYNVNQTFSQKSRLTVQNDPSLQITIDFGVKSLLSRVSYLTKLLNKDMSRQEKLELLEVIHQAKKGNRFIHVTLKGDFGLDPDLPANLPTFQEQVEFYADSYRDLIEALCIESGHSLPTKSIFLDAPSIMQKQSG